MEKSKNIKRLGNMRKTFLGYQRQNGVVGIRNFVLIIPAQGNLRMLAQKICDFVPETKSTYFP
jgi:altronate dehydratase